MEYLPWLTRDNQAHIRIPPLTVNILLIYWYLKSNQILDFFINSKTRTSRFQVLISGTKSSLSRYMKTRFTQAVSFKNTWEIFPQQTVKLAEKCHCVITDVAREVQQFTGSATGLQFRRHGGDDAFSWKAPKCGTGLGLASGLWELASQHQSGQLLQRA